MKQILSTALLACSFFLASGVCLRAQETEPPRHPPGPPHQVNGPTGEEVRLGDLLADYGKLIGKHVITDNTVSVTTVITLNGLDGLTPPQRANLISKTLFLNNYALIDADKDTVAVLGPGKNPRSVGVPLYTRPDELPADERVFSYLFKLEHRSAIELAGILQQFVPPNNMVNFTADEKAHTLIATVPTSTMLVVLKIVPALDVANEPAR